MRASSSCFSRAAIRGALYSGESSSAFHASLPSRASSSIAALFHSSYDSAYADLWSVGHYSHDFRVRTSLSRKFNSCLRSCSAVVQVVVSATCSTMDGTLPSVSPGFRIKCTRGVRNPAWLLLFLSVFLPFFPAAPSPLICSCELPGRMVSDRKDMNSVRSPCARAAMAESGPRVARRWLRGSRCTYQGSKGSGPGSRCEKMDAKGAV
jgi:hypothetical protein